MENLQKEPGWEITIPSFIPNLLSLMVAKRSREAKGAYPAQVSTKKYSFSTLLFVVIIGGFITNQLLMAKVNSNGTAQNSRPAPTVSRPPPLSAFDQNIVTQLQNEGKPPLIRRSVHSHADFKVYVSGVPFNFAKPEYFMKSAFIHVDNNQSQEDASGVLHMHAKNAPLWLFFRSLGMNVSKDSKFYLNGKKVDSWENYVFQDLDKLLISYGPENDPDIERQIKSITNFAKDH